ncbi:MAG: 16S rRNA processing protein RimM [Clostridia bacterium]|nr:16S rRNA processing protein RimM [Clostridia bacterium]MBQ8720131.1 16S rRNA processing protein RimM [Clostridia bacterium]
MRKEYIECGRACSPHGVRGAVKVESWCDSPRVLATRQRVYIAEKDGSYKELAVKSASVSGHLVLMSFLGIETREGAQMLKNTTLYLKREDIPIPEGAVLIADLIGLSVIDADTGKLYGTVADIDDGVASRIYTVKTERGDVLLPDVPEFIIERDPDRGVFVRPIPGFFD